MGIKAYLQSVTFNGDQKVDLPESGVLALVGPNNTGKSAALREINHHLTGQPRPIDQPAHVVVQINLHKEGDAEALGEWLEQNTHAFTVRSTGDRRYSRPGGQVMLSQAVPEWMNYENVLGPSLTGIFTLPAYTEQRLNLVQPAAHWNPLEESPTAPLQVLFADPALEERLSAAAKEAFGEALHLSRFPGGPIDLYVGVPTTAPSTTSIDSAYVEEIRSLPPLREQGDGMRSFVGITLALIAGTYPIVLVDEPEAFLHPPQARLLGRKIASESEKTQVLIATHSTDLLVGLLSEGAANVTVVRVTRNGAANPISVLPHEQLRQLWSDPLLASSNLLDGLFHRGVVLCEGDTDARYYASVLEDDRGDSAHELFITHCGGKARMPMVIRALGALDVPVVAVADLDVLRERDRTRAIVEALGQEWERFDRDWQVINAAVSGMSAAPSVEDASASISEALNDASSQGPRLTAKASDRIRSATKVDDGWALLKRGGIGALPQGDPAAAAQRLLSALEEIGVFVVPVGEVERWHTEIPHKSSAWLDEVLADRLYRPNGPHHQFVGGIASWFQRDD